MQRIQRRLLLGLCTCLMLVGLGLPLRASSVPTPTTDPFLLAQQPSSADAFYQQARAELPEDVYVLYRIVERIARANGLDDRPWRVGTVPEYDVNAFATDVNLLAFYDGLMDQLHGDPDALAFVVAHEMGHHTRNHIVMGDQEEASLREQFRAESVEAVAAENEDLREDLEGIEIGQWVAGGTGVLTQFLVPEAGGLGGVLGGLVGGILEGDRQKRLEAAAARIDEINEAKQTELDLKLAEASQLREFEADESGYLYATQAGFKPTGGSTAFEVLNRTIGSQDAGSHPAVPDRMAKLTALQTQYPPETLAAKGKTELATSASPLTYDLSRDGSSLRINSRAGSGDIDDLLPQ